jgi:hypothetical protein
MSCARTRANSLGVWSPQIQSDIPGSGHTPIQIFQGLVEYPLVLVPVVASPPTHHSATRPPPSPHLQVHTNSFCLQHVLATSKPIALQPQPFRTMKASSLSPKEHFAASTQLASAYICASCLFPTNAPHTSNCPHLHSPHGTSKPARKTSSVSCNLSWTDRRLHHHHHQQLYASAAEQRVQVAHHTTHSPSTMRCSFSKLHTIRSWTSERDLGMKVLPQN